MITWDDSFSVGIKAMDDQHVTLVELVSFCCEKGKGVGIKEEISIRQ